MRAIGIDISDVSAEAILAKQWFGPVTLLGHASAPLPNGSTVNGVIRDPQTVAAVLQDVLSQLLIEKNDEVYASMPESVVFNHVFTFPRQLKAQQITSGIAVQFEEYFPYSFDEAVYSWQVVNKSDTTQSVLVMSARQEYVQLMKEAVTAAGVTLAGIDIDSIASARAILPQPIPSGEAVAMIDIGAVVTTISLFDAHSIHSSHVLHNGGERLIHGLQQACDLEYDAAQTLVFQPEYSSHQAVLPVSYRDQIAEVVEKQFLPLVKTTQEAIQFYETIGTQTVTSVYLAGGASTAPGVDAFIADGLQLPVHHGDPLTHVHASDELASVVAASSYANAIGVVLGALDKRRTPVRFNLLR